MGDYEPTKQAAVGAYLMATALQNNTDLIAVDQLKQADVEELEWGKYRLPDGSVSTYEKTLWLWQVELSSGEVWFMSDVDGDFVGYPQDE